MGVMILVFYKMEGLGNDYIYFDCTGEEIQNPNALSEKLSDRHFGVGGDGIVLICKSDVADFKMRMFNADGSEGKMCGNASRCIGKFVYDLGLTNKTCITLETLSGIKTLNLDVQNGKVESVTVDMGKAILRGEDIPTKWKADTVVNQPLTVDGKVYNVTAVSMGNPHCVTFIDFPPAELELHKIGPSFENHEMFPDRTNTEFVQKLDDSTLSMRVWERGSGETLACGTGACATVVAATLCGLVERDKEITVKLIGGDLKIRYAADGTVYMTGPAKFVFKGEIIE